MLIALKGLNATLAFLLELVMFVTIPYGAYHLARGRAASWTLAVAALIIVITLWGLFAAPNASLRLGWPWRILFELLLFVLAGFVLARTGHATFGLVFIAAALASEGAALALRQ